MESPSVSSSASSSDGATALLHVVLPGASFYFPTYKEYHGALSSVQSVIAYLDARIADAFYAELRHCLFFTSDTEAYAMISALSESDFDRLELPFPREAFQQCVSILKSATLTNSDREKAWRERERVLRALRDDEQSLSGPSQPWLKAERARRLAKPMLQFMEQNGLMEMESFRAYAVEVKKYLDRCKQANRMPAMKLDQINAQVQRLQLASSIHELEVSPESEETEKKEKETETEKEKEEEIRPLEVGTRCDAMVQSLFQSFLSVGRA
jgi:hypothetical protein